MVGDRYLLRRLNAIGTFQRDTCTPIYFCFSHILYIKSLFLYYRKSWKNMHVMHSQTTPPKIDLTKSSPLKENSVNLNKQKRKEDLLNKEKCEKTGGTNDLGLGDDELPDLSIRVASVLKEKADKIANDESCIMEITENTETVNSEKSDKPKKVPEQDSGYLTTPGVSSEEENSSEPSNTDIVDNTKNLGTEKSSSDMAEQSAENENTNSHRNSDDSQNVQLRHDDNEESQCVKSNETESHSQALLKSKSSVKKVLHTGLSQGLSTLGVGVQPTLSGGPDWMIDLDDDHPPTKKPSGVTKLMERLLKHSTKRHGKKGQDVELR